jgi:hypothetical protein
MGQEVSVTYPVCKIRDATYKDTFKAICLNLNTYSKYQEHPPPFENFLGPDCLKYLYKSYPLRWNRHRKTEEPYVYWHFFSCSACIDINDITRHEKFTEHNPGGVTITNFFKKLLFLQSIYYFDLRLLCNRQTTRRNDSPTKYHQNFSEIANQ